MSHSGGLKRGGRIFAWATKGDELYILGTIQIKHGGPDWAEGHKSIRRQRHISCVNYGLDIRPMQALENTARRSWVETYPFRNGAIIPGIMPKKNLSCPKCGKQLVTGFLPSGTAGKTISALCCPMQNGGCGWQGFALPPKKKGSRTASKGRRI